MKNFNNKKAQEGGVNWLIVSLTIAAVVLILVFVWLGRTSGNFSEQTIAKQFEQKLEACIAKGETGQLDGTPYPDTDKDGLPDYCDNCPALHNFDRDITKDEDIDGFPEPKDKAEDKCCLEYKSLIGGPKKICEDEKNEKVYGPIKLFLTYLETKKA